MSPFCVIVLLLLLFAISLSDWKEWSSIDLLVVHNSNFVVTESRKLQKKNWRENYFLETHWREIVFFFSSSLLVHHHRPLSSEWFDSILISWNILNNTITTTHPSKHHHNSLSSNWSTIFTSRSRALMERGRNLFGRWSPIFRRWSTRPLLPKVSSGFFYYCHCFYCYYCSGSSSRRRRRRLLTQTSHFVSLPPMDDHLVE